MSQGWQNQIQYSSVYKKFIGVNQSRDAKMMEFDDILKDLGEFGRYQKMVYFTVCLLAIPCSWHTLGNTYLSASPKHYCRVPADAVNSDDSKTAGSYSEYESVDGSKTPKAGFEEDSKFKTCTIPRITTGRGDYEWDPCRRYANLSAGCSGDEARETMACDQEWVYDTTHYGSTAVSQVKFCR